MHANLREGVMQDGIKSLPPSTPKPAIAGAFCVLKPDGRFLAIGAAACNVFVVESV